MNYNYTINQNTDIKFKTDDQYIDKIIGQVDKIVGEITLSPDKNPLFVLIRRAFRNYIKNIEEREKILKFIKNAESNGFDYYAELKKYIEEMPIKKGMLKKDVEKTIKEYDILQKLQNISFPNFEDISKNKIEDMVDLELEKIGSLFSDNIKKTINTSLINQVKIWKQEWLQSKPNLYTFIETKIKSSIFSGSNLNLIKDALKKYLFKTDLRFGKKSNDLNNLIGKDQDKKQFNNLFNIGFQLNLNAGSYIDDFKWNITKDGTPILNNNFMVQEYRLEFSYKLKIGNNIISIFKKTKIISTELNDAKYEIEYLFKEIIKKYKNNNEYFKNLSRNELISKLDTSINSLEIKNIFDFNDFFKNNLKISLDHVWNSYAVSVFDRYKIKFKNFNFKINIKEKSKTLIRPSFLNGRKTSIFDYGNDIEIEIMIEVEDNGINLGQVNIEKFKVIDPKFIKAREIETYLTQNIKKLPFFIEDYSNGIIFQKRFSDFFKGDAVWTRLITNISNKKVFLYKNGDTLQIDFEYDYRKVNGVDKKIFGPISKSVYLAKLIKESKNTYLLNLIKNIKILNGIQKIDIDIFDSYATNNLKKDNLNMIFKSSDWDEIIQTYKWIGVTWDITSSGYVTNAHAGQDYKINFELTSYTTNIGNINKLIYQTSIKINRGKEIEKLNKQEKYIRKAINSLNIEDYTKEQLLGALATMSNEAIKKLLNKQLSETEFIKIKKKYEDKYKKLLKSIIDLKEKDVLKKIIDFKGLSEEEKQKLRDKLSKQVSSLNDNLKNIDLLSALDKLNNIVSFSKKISKSFKYILLGVAGMLAMGGFASFGLNAKLMINKKNKTTTSKIKSRKKLMLLTSTTGILLISSSTLILLITLLTNGGV